jgi:Mg2+-importing ATPase
VRTASHARSRRGCCGFVESIISQTLIIHIIRTRRLAFIESRASAALTLTTLAVCVVGLWLPYSPFASALGLVALPWAYWPLLAVMIVLYIALTHVMKIWFHWRFGLS